jgi:hypothetical protein
MEMGLALVKMVRVAVQVALAVRAAVAVLRVLPVPQQEVAA